MSVKDTDPRHHITRHPLYKIWHGMRQRCYNPKSTAYQYYGAIGIKITREWHDFATFCADMGNRPSPRHSIDRIDRKGDYTKNNCRWATQKEQNSNKTSIYKNSTTKVGGVDWEKRYNRWRARGAKNGYCKLLYQGPDFFEACCARKSWENRHKETHHVKSKSAY